MEPRKRPLARARRRVLVVDDDPLVRDLLREVLADADFDLAEAEDGSEALRLASERVPDVVVLDVMMPDLDGYEVCRRLRADPRMRGTTILMLTARTAAVDRDAGFAAGADAFFTKPFSPLDLIETVTTVSAGTRR